MSKVTRHHVLSRLLADAQACLQRDNSLDAEIVGTVRALIDQLVARYRNWNGDSITIGRECTGGKLTATELRRLTAARAESRGGFDHKSFYAIVHDCLCSELDDVRFVITGFFTVHDGLPPAEPAPRSTAPLIEVLREMIAKEEK